jgi:deoxycytidylate deaminase
VARCYVTHEPCVRCTQDLIARGCREVYYLVCYEGTDDEKIWRQRHVDEAGVVWVQMRRDDDVYTI